MPTHNRIYIAPSHTKKISGNIRWVGKDEAVYKELYGQFGVRPATLHYCLEQSWDNDDADMFDVNTLTSDEVLAEQEVVTKDVNLTDEVTLAQALATLKSGGGAKVQDKGKGIIVEPEKPLKKKDQISFDEQEAIRLQAEFDEEERLARLAQRLQAKEQEQLTTEQKATLFQELLELRRKHFAAKRRRARTRGTKKQKVDDVQETAKVDDDQEATKIKELMKIVPDEEEVYKVNAAEGVNAASEEVKVTTVSIKVTTASTKVTTASTKLMLLKELMLLVKKLVLLS
ncbi:hypothetical protein Tco_0667704 [Tanacetum coccineum]